MKKLGMLLGCGLVALAIGCGDSGSGNTAPPVTTPDSAKMREMMEKNGPGAPPAGAETPASDPAAPADAAGEKKEDPAAEKKEDAPAEKKEEEKKEEAGEKKE